MRQRVLPLVLLGSALAFLASLYLPWARWEGQGAFGFSGPNDEWTAGSGGLAGLFALALAASAAATLTRPVLARGAPIGRCALAIGYFGVAVYLQRRELFDLSQSGHVRTEYGAYLALGSAVAALLAASAIRGAELLRRPSAPEAITAVLGAGLLVAYLLPWQATFEQRGIDGLAANVAAAALCLGANLWRREAAPGVRLALIVGIAVLTGAAVGFADHYPAQRYGSWTGLGCVLALVAITAYRARHWRPVTPPRRLTVSAAAAALLVASLFLPWQESGHPAFTFTGWEGAASLGGMLALVVVGVILVRGFASYLPELVAAIALFVLTVGVQTADGDQSRVAYGAYLGFAATTLLVLGALRPWAIDRNGLHLRVPAVAACLGYLAIAVVPWWQVLPLHLELESPDRTFWLTVAGILLSLRLIASWLRRPASRELVVVPLVLLTLVTLDLVDWRDQGVGWGGVAVVALCLLLALLGWIERGGGPRMIRLPELLRVDRLRLD